MRLHPETEQCLNLKIAKVFVKVDLSKEIPRSMKYTFQGKETLVEYIYPWLPAKCTCCGKWGHTEKVCRGKRFVEEGILGNTYIEIGNEEQIRRGGTKERSVNEEIGTGEVSVSGLAAKEMSSVIGLENSSVVGSVVGSVGDLGTGIAGAVVGSDVDSVSVGGLGKGSVVETEEIIKGSGKGNLQSEGEKGWVEMSPGKTCRTPAKSNQLKFGQVSILSKSRFSVLSIDEEEDGITGNEEIDNGENEEEEKNTEEDKDLELEQTISQKEEERVNGRQYLPRGSKNKHKYLKDVVVQRARDEGPGDLNKKKKPRNGQ